jgi:adenine-specific DNA-methyltransferase
LITPETTPPSIPTNLATPRLVDLVHTDPPYNTGQFFRYNDRWDTDPNDPDLGTLVTKEDGSRHTKWIKAMMPRLQMMKAMLKPSGIVAICIDDNELFHLGMMMDEVFGEENRLAIINWQKTTPKNARHVATTTDYVLVYAKDKQLTLTELLPRSEKADLRFGNRDNDVLGEWKQGDVTGKRSPTSHKSMTYAVQSPFTGELHYPLETRHWAFEKGTIKKWLTEWGSVYEERDLKDGKPKALVIKGAPTRLDRNFSRDHKRLIEAQRNALDRLEAGNWPKMYFGVTGDAQPMLKVHASHVKSGTIPTTFWIDELDPDRLQNIGPVSWAASESGRSREGVEELEEIIGKGHGFETVKPLSLTRKIIQLWCPPNGLVLDPYAGSGTTAHAVLELNAETGADRRFIMVEQGAPETGDKYARTLTWERLNNAATGKRPNGNQAEPLGGGFEYRLLTRTIDARTVMTMKRDELIDVVLTSHWETHRRTAPNLQRYDEADYQYLIGRDEAGEGYFLIWNNGGPVGSLDLDSYKIVTGEAKRAALHPPFHVYARYETFQTPNVRFWKIPDKVLAHLGLNENESYNDPNDEDEAA